MFLTFPHCRINNILLSIFGLT